MSDKSFTLRCERIKPNTPTKNGNVYTLECLKHIVAVAQPDIVQRRLIGRLGQTSEHVTMREASHMVTGLWLDEEDGHLAARIEVLTTPQGNMLWQQLSTLGEDAFEVVPYATASVFQNEKGQKIVMDEGYKLRSLDVCPKRDFRSKAPDNVKTVKVRVPVVVDEHGNCYSVGWANLQKDPAYRDDFEDMQEQAFECHLTSFPESQTRVTRWATLEVPVPDSETELPGIIRAEGEEDEADT